MKATHHRALRGQPRPGGDPKRDPPYPADQGGQPAVDIIDSFRQSSHGDGDGGGADWVLK